MFVPRYPKNARGSWGFRMRCEDVVRDLPLLLYGELSFDEEEKVEQHLSGCQPCTREREQLRALHLELDAQEAEVPSAFLAECRRTLRQNVESARQSAPVRRTGVLGFINEFLQADWTMWLKPAGAVALLSIGFFTARLFPDKAGNAPVPSTSEMGVMEPAASRVRFVEPDQNGRVRIGLEETSQRVLSGSAEDGNIRRLLLAAALQSADPGLRVDSVDVLSADAASADVKKALLYALQHDSNPGVRLKALDGLRASAADPETRKVLANVLLSDNNPGVRTQAIDLLIQRKERDVVGVLQEALKRDENNYVRYKCQRALLEMRASAESF